MSQHRIVKSKCFICGKESEQMIMVSSNTLGGMPDLDMRPAGMLRGTMHMWTQKCPECGYVSEKLENCTTVTREWLEREEYRLCGGLKFLSWLAERFYKLYLISTEERKSNSAYNAAMCAAWACDDRGDEENAVHCRLCALKELDTLIAAEERSPENLLVLKTDLLRRTGQFAALLAEYEGRSYFDELLDSIVAFQLEKARQGDRGCYRIDDAACL